MEISEQAKQAALSELREFIVRDDRAKHALPEGYHVQQLLQEKDAEIGKLKKESADYRSYLYGCDNHRLWKGMACIGCLEQERDTLRSTVEELHDYTFHRAECDHLYSKPCSCGLSQLEGIKR